MLRYGYWLCEYLSISSIILKGPSKYSRAFLYTETDDNDLTYFLLFHANVLNRSILSLQAYLERQLDKLKEVDAIVARSVVFNHRQKGVLSEAIRDSAMQITIKAHQTTHAVAYQTARKDLLELVELNLLRLYQICETIRKLYISII